MSTEADQIQALLASERSERLFTAAVEALDEGIIVQNKRGRVVRANSSASKILGIEGGNFKQMADPRTGWRAIRTDGSEFVPTDFPGYVTSTTGEPQRGVVMGVVSPTGATTWLSINSFPTDLDDEPLVVSTFTDITKQRAMTEALRESEERTRAILETAAEGIITTDEQGVILEFNAAAERILGFDSDDTVGRPLADLIDADERSTIVEMYETHLAGRQTPLIGQPATELTFLHKDGTTVPTEFAVTDTPTSEGHLFTSVLHDISERKAFERELEHQATHDALTGLPNRALLAAELDAALVRSLRKRRGVGVLFTELGRMKVVTDSLGHRAGDDIVLEAIIRLEESVGCSVTITRWGGDHLVLFAEDLDDVGGVVAIATEVIDVLERPYLIGSEEAFIKASVGIAFVPNGAGTAESLISNADVAMHRARTAAGPGFEVFDTEMRHWVDSRRTLEVSMRHGIDRHEFELHYQPVITVSSGAIHGFEALVRWNHPEFGQLLPNRFIPLAEDSGLIVPLGEKLLRDACAQLSRWQQTYPDVTVSVNLSGVQLALPDLATTVASALLESGADPRGLDLEITETVLLDDVEAAVATLHGLKKLGVNLVLDDFGTGYSSLSYLCRFPIDVVKVDQSFVSQLGTESRDASMVSVVVGMAQTLSMDVVAEGIETTEQLAVLSDLDCIYAQGFLFSKARPAEEAEQLLATKWHYPEN